MNFECWLKSQISFYKKLKETRIEDEYRYILLRYAEYLKTAEISDQYLIDVDSFDKINR